MRIYPGPWKNFWEELTWFWKKRKCSHPRVRCVHGDEIIRAGYRRSLCKVCYRYLDGLPEFCSYTLLPHSYTKPEPVTHTMAPQYK